MKKCFEGIAKLNFTENMEVTTMKSSEGEQVTLEDVIDTNAARGQVERWLLELESDMKSSVRAQVPHSVQLKSKLSIKLEKKKIIIIILHSLKVMRAKNNYLKTKRNQWVLKWPGQTILCIGQLYWTAEVTAAFANAPDSLDKYIRQCTNQLNEIIVLVRGTLSKQNRTTLGKSNYRLLVQNCPFD